MISIQNLSKCYANRFVLQNLSLNIPQGEWRGIVGESGSGKSTLARILMGVDQPTLGEIYIQGVALKRWRRSAEGRIGVVFQDYHRSINPHFTIQTALEEAFWCQNKRASLAEISTILEQVELSSTLLRRYPHELSGGQLQRVSLARALALQPKFLILDEALSALDVSTKVEIIRLLQKAKEQSSLTALIIAHDLETILALCERFGVLCGGCLIEEVESRSSHLACHPYTQELLGALLPLPHPKPQRERIS
ncbi:MAG: ABC transporter ATP-binding protein [Wolinella sp.]